MIDSHCHLDHEPLAQNIHDVLSRCKKEGVNKVLTISTTLSGFPKILEIVNKDEMIYKLPVQADNKFHLYQIHLKNKKEKDFITGQLKIKIEFEDVDKNTQVQIKEFGIE